MGGLRNNEPFLGWHGHHRTKAGTATADFDARNSQLSDGSSAFTYTPRGTLASADDGSCAPRKLAFDAFERKITDGGTACTYDSLDRMLTRGQTAFTYDGGSNKNLAADGNTHYSRTPGGSLLSTATGTVKQWSVTDQHTDRVAGLSPDGTAVTGSTAYSPFGVETASNETTSSSGYHSAWTDPDSGDVNMAARWPRQPVCIRRSRPLDGTDPSGHSTTCAPPRTLESCRSGGRGGGRGRGGRLATDQMRASGAKRTRSPVC